MSRYLASQPDPAAIIALLAKDVIHEALLLELQFVTGTIYLSNEIPPFTDLRDGYVWQGMGNLVGIGTVNGGVNVRAPVMEYQLGIPWELLTVDERGTNGMGLIPGLIGDRANYVNRPARLWSQLFDDATPDAQGRPSQVGHPTAEHFGLMDKISISFSPEAAILSLSVEGLMARKAAPTYGRLTHRDQLRRYPGDLGLRFVPEVMSTDPQWTDW